jgi:hypothetical protein
VIYNPNVQLEIGLYRSNAVLAHTITHWHSNKQHICTEMDAMVEQITQELTPILGTKPNQRGFSQLPDGKEYLAEVGRQCEKWWNEQGVPLTVVHETPEELGPY